MGLRTVIRPGFEVYAECDGQDGLPKHKNIVLKSDERCPMCKKAREEKGEIIRSNKF